MLELDPTDSREDRVLAYRRLLGVAARRGAEARRVAERWLATHDLFYLLTVILRRRDLDQDFTFARCQEVQASPNGHLDLWAREHGKTSIISFGLTIQDIVRDPEVTIGIFSHTRPMARRILRQVKTEFERNEWLKGLFDDALWAEPHKQAPKWSEEDGLVVRRLGNPGESTLEAWGMVDGLPTGKHFQIRVYDQDVRPAMHAESPAGASETERTSLATHVDLCELRYRSLERRMSRVEYSIYALVALMIFGRDHLIDVLRLLTPHAIVLAVLAGAAMAAPPDGADPDGPVADWYRGLTDGEGRGCCSIADCRHLPTRIGPHGFEVFAGGEWIPVPPDKIIPNKENPTGEPVTCWLPGRGVMCFVEGAGT